MTRLLAMGAVLSLLGMVWSAHAADVLFEAETLPQTTPLKMEEPLHQLMVRGISEFAERELHRIQDERDADWLPSGRTTAVQDPKFARARLSALIGVVDPVMNRSLIYRHQLQSAAGLTAQAIRWDVGIDGVSGDGLALVHDLPAAPGAPLCVFLGDADQSPEELLGWLPPAQGGEPNQVHPSQLVQALVSRGVDVYCPRLIDRQLNMPWHTYIPLMHPSNLSRREFVYRCGFELGRHIIGYEVGRVLSLVGALKTAFPDRSIVLLGVGEGGLISLHAGALGEDRGVDAVVVRGYFSTHRDPWKEPLERNVWQGERYYGNAELASLIAPRPLLIDPSSVPVVEGPPEPLQGWRKIAAPGSITTPPLKEVQGEFARAQAYYSRAGHPDQVQLLEPRSGDAQPEDVLRALSELMPIDWASATKPIQVPAPPGIDSESVDRKQKQLLYELILHTQSILHRSDKVRAARWNQTDRSSVGAWETSAQALRAQMHEELIGRLPEANTEWNPRSRRVIDEPTHTGYDVLLDVYGRSDDRGASLEPGTIVAGGILLLPKDLKVGERRPVVVCQHGLEGVPEDTITADQESRAWRAYKAFATQLVQRGFIVYAPQNPYKGFDDFRVIQRKSNPVGRSLFSYIIEQHRQTLHWLASLPCVDADRIGFYGLSYGGKTAVRVPPLLVDKDASGQDRPLYCLSICSADFNEWIRKNASAEDPMSYVYAPEYEIWEWNMGHLAGYAELSSLMAPGPFMVERGHDDGVAPDEWVGWEFAKVRRHYDKLGLGDRTEIEWFNGPHTINGQGTFRFLERHLNWPLVHAVP